MAPMMLKLQLPFGVRLLLTRIPKPARRSGRSATVSPLTTKSRFHCYCLDPKCPDFSSTAEWTWQAPKAAG